MSTTPKSSGYLENLKQYDRDLTLPDMVFQQDNAPGHIGEVVPNFVAQKQLGVLDRPAYCPDLNSIENIWPILKKTCEVNQIGI